MAFAAGQQVTDDITSSSAFSAEPESESEVFKAAVKNLEEYGLGDILYTPARQPRTYSDRVNSYWSLTPRVRPWAIIQPRNTAEVSKALVALAVTDCKFAIRRYHTLLKEHDRFES